MVQHLASESAPGPHGVLGVLHMYWLHTSSGRTEHEGVRSGWEKRVGGTREAAARAAQMCDWDGQVRAPTSTAFLWTQIYKHRYRYIHIYGLGPLGSLAALFFLGMGSRLCWSSPPLPRWCACQDSGLQGILFDRVAMLFNAFSLVLNAFPWLLHLFPIAFGLLFNHCTC